MLRSDPGRLDWALGEAITATASRVIANVFDGDLAPIFAVIEDAEAEEYARGAMIEALGALLRQGRAPREQVIAYLRDCPSRLAEAGEAFWGTWACMIADLRLAELRDAAERAFDDDLIHEGYVGREDVRRALDGKETPMSRDSYEPFGDPEKELASWHFADPTKSGRGEAVDPIDRRVAAYEPMEPAFNPHRHVGRNDPCPCGSGKKFKKCCGG